MTTKWLVSITLAVIILLISFGWNTIIIGIDVITEWVYNLPGNWDLAVATLIHVMFVAVVAIVIHEMITKE